MQVASKEKKILQKALGGARMKEVLPAHRQVDSLQVISGMNLQMNDCVNHGGGRGQDELLLDRKRML